MFIYIQWNTINGVINISKTKPIYYSIINNINFDENIVETATYNDDGCVCIELPDNTTELHFFWTKLELGGRYNRELYLYCLKNYQEVEKKALEFSSIGALTRKCNTRTLSTYRVPKTSLWGLRCVGGC